MNATLTRETLDGFIVPFDIARPDEQDAQAAGRIFGDGLDEIFLTHMGFVHGFDHRDGGPLYANVRMMVPATDQSHLRILTQNYNKDAIANRPPYQRFDQRVTLTEVRPDGSEGRLVIYSFDRDRGSVTRRDVSDDWSEELRLRRLTNPIPDFTKMTDLELSQHLEDERLRSRGEVRNLELEIVMGVNEQEVTSGEARKLIELIKTAQPVAEFPIPRLHAPNQLGGVERYLAALRRVAAALIRLVRKAN